MVVVLALVGVGFVAVSARGAGAVDGHSVQNVAGSATGQTTIVGIAAIG